MFRQVSLAHKISFKTVLFRCGLEAGLNIWSPPAGFRLTQHYKSRHQATEATMEPEGLGLELEEVWAPLWFSEIP